MKHSTYLRLTGRYFGFPKCCINQFVKEFNNAENLNRKKRLLVANGTGFVPCIHHAESIYKGELQLSDLIENRICKLPFPKQGDYIDLQNYLKTITTLKIKIK